MTVFRWAPTCKWVYTPDCLPYRIGTVGAWVIGGALVGFLWVWFGGRGQIGKDSPSS